MIRFFELGPSPNNTKVRMALRFKGLEFEAVPVDPFDRAQVVEASGQQLTPVIEDRGIVLNDSEAILHYLDANYRETPRLFASDRAGRKACDAFKAKLDAEVATHWAPVFFHAIGVQETLDEDARERFSAALAALDDALGQDASFAEGAGPVNDLRVAEWATYALPGEGLLERIPLFNRFRDLYGVAPASLPRLERFLAPWNERLA